MEKVMTMNKKKTHKFPVYVVKRMGLAKWKYWLIRNWLTNWNGYRITSAFTKCIVTAAAAWSIHCVTVVFKNFAQLVKPQIL